MQDRLLVYVVALFAWLSFSPALRSQSAPASAPATQSKPDDNADAKWNSIPPIKPWYAGRKSAPAPKRDLSGVWDAAEADQLYSALEHDVIPAFYDRDEQGVPRRWVAKMRESLARLTPQFSANRTVREYTEQHYLPAASAYCSRASGSGKQALAIRQWQRQLAIHWNSLRFGEVHIESNPDRHNDCGCVHVLSFLFLSGAFGATIRLRH